MIAQDPTLRIPTVGRNGVSTAQTANDSRPGKPGKRSALAAPEARGRPQSGRNAVLGKNTKFPSAQTQQTGVKDPPTLEEVKKQQDKRDARYTLREGLRGLSSMNRQAYCGLRRINEDFQPEIRLRDGIAHLTGLQLCGNVWTCPVCGPKIRQERAKEVDGCCVKMIESHGVGSVYLLTLTMKHGISQSLKTTKTAITSAFTEMISGRGWQALKKDFGLLHYIKAMDCTHGENGWHPHLHILLFADSAMSEGNVNELERLMFARWAKSFHKLGLPKPSRRYGIKLEQARDRQDVANYVMQVVVDNERVAGSKPKSVAMEMTRGDLKTARFGGHRTPWQILSDLVSSALVTDGVCDEAAYKDLQLWKEWEKETFRLQAVRWSVGLKKLVGLDEKTDEDITEEEVGGVKVFTFSRVQWTTVTKIPGILVILLRAAEANPHCFGISQFLDTLVHVPKRERFPGT